MASIFVSYRRSDAGGWAGRLVDSLHRSLPKADIFVDVDKIPPGVPFAEYIAQEVGRCDALLVLIGPHWSAPENLRRLSEEDDFVRLEITAAMKRNIRVIPTRVGDAPLPDKDTLPEDIRKLLGRQDFVISDRSWDDDCKRLALHLKPILGHEAVDGRRRWLGMASAAVAAGAAGSGGYVWWRNRDRPTAPTPASGPGPTPTLPPVAAAPSPSPTLAPSPTPPAAPPPTPPAAPPPTPRAAPSPAPAVAPSRAPPAVPAPAPVPAPAAASPAIATPLVPVAALGLLRLEGTWRLAGSTSRAVFPVVRGKDRSLRLSLLAPGPGGEGQAKELGTARPAGQAVVFDGPARMRITLSPSGQASSWQVVMAEGRENGPDGQAVYTTIATGTVDVSAGLRRWSVVLVEAKASRKTMQMEGTLAPDATKLSVHVREGQSPTGEVYVFVRD